jgi:hypothetical protein
MGLCLLAEAESETTSEQHQTPKEKALQALEHLQQAVGGELPWELEDSDQPSHVGTSNPDQPSHLGTSNPDDLSHVGNRKPCFPPCPELSKCDSSHTSQHANGPASEAQSVRPAPKVTPIRSPFSNKPNQCRFESQAPALLNEVMARLRFNPDARVPTKAQRKALLRRDRYRCRTPGCPLIPGDPPHHPLQPGWQDPSPFSGHPLLSLSQEHRGRQASDSIEGVGRTGLHRPVWPRPGGSAASGKGHLARLLVGLEREGDGFALGSGDELFEGALARPRDS